MIKDHILNRVLGTPPGAALNTSAPPDRIGFVPANLAGELKRCMSSIQSEAITGDGSRVDYQMIRASQSYVEYRALTNLLSGFDLRTLESRADKLAFWINLYNSLVIDAVIQEDVKVSVTESWLGILGFFQKSAYWVNGLRFSLADIEHGILRQNRGIPYFPGAQFATSDYRKNFVIDPMDLRIHFALNCASLSCPPIQFYSPEDLDMQLDLAASNFINQDLEIGKKEKHITISRIFSWYRQDFGGNHRILNYLSNHLKDPVLSSWFKENLDEIKIRFQPYDWTLNRMS